ncbi:MAG TPA: ATP-binding protein [Bacteroidales bacterium]|nr:ATP-binding protein [Bacteroidales bacterium]
MKAAKINNPKPGISFNDDKFQVLIETAPDAFLWGNSEGDLILVNNKATELTGYSKDELLSMNISALFNSNVLAAKPLRYDLLDSGKTIIIEREIVTKSGTVVQIEMNSKAMSDGTYQSFLRDISERKEAEEAIRISEARLQRAEIASKSGNWELHLDTNEMIASVGASKIYGIATDHMNFSVVKEVPLPEYRPMLDNALKELIENDRPYDIEFKIRAVDTGIIKDIHSIAEYDIEKKVLFGVIQDITEQKKVEEELIKAKEKAEESDRLKTAFLQNLSHEIRTPMNAIIGFSELLKDSYGNKEKLHEFTNIIRQRSHDLLSIINDILDIAKIESGQLQVNTGECDIHALFDDLSEFFKEYQQRTKRADVRFLVRTDINRKDAIILTDKVKLRQILINLISNAFKFTPQGTVITGCKKDDDNQLLFYVSDTGIGIPADKQEAVFDRFTQLHQIEVKNAGGNGLGLSIVKGLVKLLGGEISLESKPGEGSTFSFSVPCMSTLLSVDSEIGVKTSLPENSSQKTILVVEDDAFNAAYVKEILTLSGLKMLLATTGNEAVELARINVVDLILMDIRLPDINGYEATRRIKQYKPYIKIIAYTAYATTDEKEKAVQAGCIDYISKPAKKDFLLNKLAHHLSVNYF